MPIRSQAANPPGRTPNKKHPTAKCPRGEEDEDDRWHKPDERNETLGEQLAWMAAAGTITPGEGTESCRVLERKQTKARIIIQVKATAAETCRHWTEVHGVAVFSDGSRNEKG
jgi:hypothetical protein